MRSKEHPNDLSRPSPWFWLLIPLAGLGLWWMEMEIWDRTPAPEEWSTVLEPIKENVLPTDGVVLLPGWHEYPGPLLSAALEGAGHDGHLIRATPLTMLDTARYPRVWLILVGGEDIPPLLRNCAPEVETPNVSVCLWSNPTTLPKFDAIAELKNARVERKERGKTAGKSCTWEEDRHRCQTAKRMYDVRSYVGEVGNTRRKAIFAHPYPSKGSLQVNYSLQAPLMSLRFSYGNALRGVRMEDGTSVRVRLTLDDKELFTDEVAIDDFGWKTKTLKFQAKPGQNLRFDVEAEESSWRHFFIDAIGF